MDRIEVEPALVMCAFRYALGRRSYMVGLVADEVDRVKDKLSFHVKDRMIDEIMEAIDDEAAGDPCDVQTWQGLKQKLVKDIYGG